MNLSNSTYAIDITVREALSIFYQKLGEGDDGGISKSWIKINVGKFYIPFPNFPARKKAVLFHDVHHILTGYETHWKGEVELGAWEVATGCGYFRAAWLFDMGSLAMGLFLYPVATYRAFVRGWRNKNFYHETHTYQQILGMTVAEAQALLKLNIPPHESSLATGWIAFIGYWILSFIVSFLVFVAPVVYIIHCIID